MKGHLRQRSKGSWSVVISWRENGKPRQKWETVRGTRALADKRLRELLSQMDSGLFPIIGNQTVGDYLKVWLRDIVTLRNRPRTVESYSVIVNNHIIPAIGSIQLTKLQPAAVQRMEASLLESGLSASTVHHVHICLSKALKDATRAGLLNRNVCLAVQPPSPGAYEVSVPETYAVNQILILADAGTYGPMLRFMAFTGVRRGEAVGLKWENVDLERSVVSIVASAQRLKGKGIVLQPPKSSAGRRGIAIDAGIVDMLRGHQGRQLLYKIDTGDVYKDNGLVFPGPRGGLLDPSVVTRNFEKLARRAGYPGIRLHDLRHAHAAGLIKAGIHPKVVQDRLGHASAAFTMQVYGHLAAGLQGKAAEAFAELMAETG